MRVLVPGGSGRTRKLIITEALSRGHTITALVRKPDSVSELQSPSLQILQGSPQNKQGVVKAFTTQTPDALLMTLCSNEEEFMASVHRPLVEGIKEKVLEGKTKVVTMQALETGSSNENLWWPMRMMVKYSPLAMG